MNLYMVKEEIGDNYDKIVDLINLLRCFFMCRIQEKQVLKLRGRRDRGRGDGGQAAQRQRYGIDFVLVDEF